MSQAEKDTLLSKLSLSENLMVGIKLYQEEEEYLKNYLLTHKDLKVTGFRSYPANLYLPGGPPQPTLVYVAMGGEFHDELMNNPGDIIIGGCEFFDVKEYPKDGSYQIAADLTFDDKAYDQSANRNYIITSVRDLEKAVEDVDPDIEQRGPIPEDSSLI